MCFRFRLMWDLPVTGLKLVPNFHPCQGASENVKISDGYFLLRLEFDRTPCVCTALTRKSAVKNLWPTKTVWLMLKEVKIRLPNLKVNSLHSLKTSPLEPLKTNLNQVKLSLHLTEAKEAETGLKAMAAEEGKAIVSDLKEARGRMAEAKEKLKVVNVG